MEIKKKIIITQEDYETSYYKVKSRIKVQKKIFQIDYETSFLKLVCKPCIRPARSTAPYASRALARRGPRRRMLAVHWPSAFDGAVCKPCIELA